MHNGIDVRRFQQVLHNKSTRKEWGIAPSDFVIGFIGRLEEQKGITYLLQAIEKLNCSFSHLKVVIVGEGSLSGQFLVQAISLRLTNVRFTGFQRDTPKFLGMFDVFVLPSLFEGLPVSAIQAMAAGLPVVASRVGGIEEVVEHEVTGLLVEPAHPQELAGALSRLVENPERRLKMGEQAREHAMLRFSAEAMVAKTEGIYAELLEAS